MSGIVTALAAPLRALLDAFGTGDLSTAGVDAAIRAIETELERISAQTRSTNVSVGQTWTGTDSAAAQRTIGSGGVTATALAQHTGELRKSVTTAAQTVKKGHAELSRILDSFVRQAEAANPSLTNPAGLIAVLTLAANHLQQALDVLRRVRSELDGESGTVAQLASNTPTAPATVNGGAATTPGSTTPATMPSWTGSSGGSTSGGSGGVSSGGGFSALPSSLTGSSGASSGSAGGSSRSARASTASLSRTSTTSTTDPSGGVAIRLPDGSVVRAPNARAAAAVQAALTQLGVPYAWGGTSPGVGLDCSGLTQWAYRQAGIELPRVADAQSVGAQVSSSDLQPGDLAVWDGHVAMVVGNGLMVEAGDPVQLSSIRTDNIGQGFHGFWRPTA